MENSSLSLFFQVESTRLRFMTKLFYFIFPNYTYINYADINNF